MSEDMVLILLSIPVFIFITGILLYRFFCDPWKDLAKLFKTDKRTDIADNSYVTGVRFNRRWYYGNKSRSRASKNLAVITDENGLYLHESSKPPLLIPWSNFEDEMGFKDYKILGISNKFRILYYKSTSGNLEIQIPEKIFSDFREN